MPASAAPATKAKGRFNIDAFLAARAMGPGGRVIIRDWAPGRGVEDYLLAATIVAIKPDPSHLP